MLSNKIGCLKLNFEVNPLKSSKNNNALGKDIFRRKSIYLLILAKDGGNILRVPHTGEFIKLLDWIADETFTTVDGLQYTYRNICFHYQNKCFEDMHARFIADIFHRGDQVGIHNMSHFI